MGNSDCDQPGALQRKRRTAQINFRGIHPAQLLWNQARATELTLRETFEVCRQCHKLAPFCFYNGNTFAAIGRTMIQDINRKLTPAQTHILRSVVGHYIAGTTGIDELSKVLDALI